MIGARSQPQGLIRLSSRANRAIVYPLAAGNQILGNNSATRPVLGPDITIKGAGVGRYYSLTAQASSFIRLGANPLMQAEVFSAVMVFRFPSLPPSGTAYTIFESGAEPSTNVSNGSFQFRVNENGGLEIIQDNQAAILAGASGQIVAGKFHTVSVVALSGNTGRGRARIAVDGLMVVDTATNANNYLAGNFTLGTKNGTTNEKGAVDFALFAYWPTEITPTDQAHLSRYPWSIFEDPSEQEDLFIVQQARALTANTGSYALSGNPAQLLSSKRLPANTGAYSVAGVPANLRAGRYLLTAPGAYGISGKQVNLVRGTPPKSLQVEYGTYAIVGAAAGLKATRRAIAAPGMYSLTGYATGASSVGIVPDYYAATIMRFSSINLTAELGPAEIYRTVSVQ